MPHQRARALLAVVGATLLAGCSSGAVTVNPWQPPDAVATICARLAATLPAELDVGNRRLATRDVNGVPAGAVARSWGDPPVVLRCGVPRPPEYRPDDVLLTVDGVDWLDVAGEGGRFFTTWGRVAYVEVAVPAAYAPEPTVLTAVAAAIRRNVPVDARGDSPR